MPIGRIVNDGPGTSETTTTVILTEEAPQSHPPQEPRALMPRSSRSDVIFRAVSFSAGGMTVAIMLAVGLFLSLRAGSALQVAGFGFLTSSSGRPRPGSSASPPCCSARS